MPTINFALNGRSPRTRRSMPILYYVDHVKVNTNVSLGSDHLPRIMGFIGIGDASAHAYARIWKMLGLHAVPLRGTAKGARGPRGIASVIMMLRILRSNIGTIALVP